MMSDVYVLVSFLKVVLVSVGDRYPGGRGETPEANPKGIQPKLVSLSVKMGLF